MIRTSQKITIIKVRRPRERNVNQELQWFGTSLGLFNLRDKEKSCFRIFIELLKAAKMRTRLSSDDIAQRLELSRGTVVHHINKLISTGIVIPEGRGYVLRVDKLETLVEEIRRDLQRTIDDLQEVAEDIDGWLGL